MKTKPLGCSGEAQVRELEVLTRRYGGEIKEERRGQKANRSNRG